MIISLSRDKIERVRDYGLSLQAGIRRDAMLAAVAIWEATNGPI